MEIISIGYDFRHGTDFKISRPLGLNEYLLLVIRSTAYFEMNGQLLHTDPASAILIDKSTPHSFYSDGTEFVNDWISFELEDGERDRLLNSGITFDSFLKSFDSLFLSDIMRLMQKEKLSAGLHKNENINSLFKIAFRKIHESSAYAEYGLKNYAALRSVREYIYSNPAENHNITDLAAKVNLSKSHFQLLYRRFFGATPLSDVINSRIEFAKQLLSSTDYSVAKISELSGYPNDVQFIKQFKQTVGLTPKKYRIGK